MSLQCTIVAKTKKSTSILGCLRISNMSRLRNIILPLYSALMWMHLEFCVQFWVPQYKKDKDLLEKPRAKPQR